MFQIPCVEYSILPKAFKPKATITELYYKIITMPHYINHPNTKMHFFAITKIKLFLITKVYILNLPRYLFHPIYFQSKKEYE